MARIKRACGGPEIVRSFSPFARAPGLAGGLAVDIGIGPHGGAGLDDGAGAVKERAAVDVPEIRAHGRRRFSVVGTDEWHRC